MIMIMIITIPVLPGPVNKEISAFPFVYEQLRVFNFVYISSTVFHDVVDVFHPGDPRASTWSRGQ